MAQRLRGGETIVFIGDSITDCGRMEPQHQPLGCGYVRMFADMLAVREPETEVRILNRGIGGNTIEDLRSRWIDDALSHKPDLLSVQIGINDCNRYLTDPAHNGLQSPNAYEEIYDAILKLACSALPELRLLLIDPFFASLDRDGMVENSYRARMHGELTKYIAAVERMEAKFGTLRVRTHELFRERSEYRHPSVFFPREPVHPNSAGHMLIAEGVCSALGVRSFASFS